MKYEISLSRDINRIETEIQFYKEKAGESIWEIGRRLNHVKEHDLTHGEFVNWVENQGIQYREANRMMKVADELNPDMTTLSHLGSSALYLIATLPEDERDIEHVTANGATKTPDEMTVRELQELKKELKEKNKQIEAQQRVIDEQADAEPIIVEKEVMHPHVNDLRSDNEQLSKTLKVTQSELDSLSKRNEFIEQQYKQLLEQRTEVDEKSEKYDQLSEAISSAKGELNTTQKLISDHKHVMKILKQGNELLMSVSGLAYVDISTTVTENKLINREFESLVIGLERLTRDLKNMNNQNIIEGEFTND